jgi:hypothetical protein
MNAELKETLTEREKELRREYKRVLPGTIKKESGGVHAGKFSVEISCRQRGCANTRRVATSDLFQIDSCETCTKRLRAQRRRDRRKNGGKAKDGRKANKARVRTKPAMATA